MFAREEDYPQSADRFSYSRYGNPNVAETEEQLAEIEGAEWAVLTVHLSASGMARYRHCTFKRRSSNAATRKTRSS